MAPEKVTVMILDVDLQCSCCYKKVKKLLCKFPQIRDQMFDEAKNKVTITVVCCNPEKIRDKLCYKGGNSIQCIEIVDDKPKPPEKPKQPEKPKPVEKPKEPEKPKPVDKTKEPEKPKPVEKPKEPEKPKPPPVVVPVPVPVEKPKADPPKVDPPRKPDPAPTPMPPVVLPQPEPVKMPEPMYGYPEPFCPPPAFPVSACCQECYEGRGGGPCHYGYGGYGRPVPPPPGPCYDGYGYQYGGNRPCYATRCDYFSEENPQGCSIM